MDDNDFFEEDDTIFGQDEVFDYILLDKIEKGEDLRTGAGCLSAVLLLISTFSGFAILVFWVIE